MSATKKTSILQRLASAWESPDELDTADMGTAFGMDYSISVLEAAGRDDDAHAAADSWCPHDVDD